MGGGDQRSKPYLFTKPNYRMTQRPQQRPEAGQNTLDLILQIIEKIRALILRQEKVKGRIEEIERRE